MNRNFLCETNDLIKYFDKQRDEEIKLANVLAWNEKSLFLSWMSLKILLLCKSIFKSKKFIKLILRLLHANVKFAEYLTKRILTFCIVSWN